MKRRYDATVKPQSYAIDEKVLVYNPKKRHGEFAKWQSCWTGPFVVKNKLNQMNYVVKEGRGKSAVIHIDRMRKLPNELDLGSPDCRENDMCLTSQPKLRHKATNTTMETNTHCAKTASCADSDTNAPLFPSMDNFSDHSSNTCVSIGLDICNPAVAESQSTDGASTAIAESAATQHRPCPALANRPTRVRRRPARFLETMQARWLPN